MELGINVILELGNHLNFFTFLLGNHMVADNQKVVVNVNVLKINGNDNVYGVSAKIFVRN